jgi:hypothetical protein
MTLFQPHKTNTSQKNEKKADTYTQYRKNVIPNWSVKWDLGVPASYLE